MCVEKDAKQNDYAFAWGMIEGTLWKMDLCYSIDLA